MLDALRERLIEKPDQYLDEMAVFLWDEFEVLVTTSTISRTLKTIEWSKKTARRVALGRSAELRDLYLYDLSAFESYHVVYVDESGCDKRIGFRRTAWSPLGVTPVQIARFHRGQRYHILPAYTQDGILYSHIYQGTTDSAVFEKFIEELLPHCGRWPEPKSVLIMDNASFHHSPKVQRMCDDAGVKLLFLAPYSPNLNPIEELFAEYKADVKKDWPNYDPNQDFFAYLQSRLDLVGSNKVHARGHFRSAGWKITEWEIE